MGLALFVKKFLLVLVDAIISLKNSYRLQAALSIGSFME
jgi:hypothetical protein